MKQNSHVLEENRILEFHVCVCTCVWRIIFIFQLKFHQQFENSSAKEKKMERHE